ncbi:hypothetical protein EUGRSUZ_C00896 [Eucalyptus grandis]|uniref:Uncharacterized protein n=2 Tax=Eucalyptus grandis TaxID=71139 RepID=A0ACC3LDE0_EUCGR|nr:hypothetical protein EUGRSUZ_C00896 [Eucalyptus grandis]
MPKWQCCHQTASRRIADEGNIIDPCPEKQSDRGLSTVSATSSYVQVNGGSHAHMKKPLFLEFYVPY